MIIYTGIFYKSEDLPTPSLEKEIEFPHTTLHFKPIEDLSEFFGSEMIVEVIGYANDGENEGLLVDIIDGPSELLEKYSEIRTPHITLSCSKDGKPVNTRFLKFHSCERYKIKGVFGGFNGKFVELSKLRHN